MLVEAEKAGAAAVAVPWEDAISGAVKVLIAVDDEDGVSDAGGWSIVDEANADDEADKVLQDCSSKVGCFFPSSFATLLSFVYHDVSKGSKNVSKSEVDSFFD